VLQEKSQGSQQLTQITEKQFNSLYSGTTWVSQYQKGKMILNNFNKARDDGVLK